MEKQELINKIDDFIAENWAMFLGFLLRDNTVDIEETEVEALLEEIKQDYE